MGDLRPRTASDWRSSRARAPVAEGFVGRDGVRIFWEVFGSGEPTVLILPTWSVLHAAHGRFQIADLARRYRVVTFDPRGNGRSDRPAGAAAYDDRSFVADAVAVLDATSTKRAVVIGCSQATFWLLGLAAQHPDRVLGAVASGTNLPLAPGHPTPDDVVAFDEPFRSTLGWATWNAAFWRERYEDFLRFFFSQVWTEPYSAGVIEDSVTWGLETDPETLIATAEAPGYDEDEVRALLARVRSPMLVIHGRNDAVTPLARGARLADLAGAKLEVLDGAGHCPGNRDPVRFDRLIVDFIEGIHSATVSDDHVPRPADGSRRVLVVPSGVDGRAVDLGISISNALLSADPGLTVQWLAASPARERLERSKAVVHPASDGLVRAEVAGGPGGGRWTAEQFDLWRRGDEARFANYMVFDDLVACDAFDLVVAIGADGIDHYLHEDPGSKRFAFAWLTDRVGWEVTQGDAAAAVDLMVDANRAMAAMVERLPPVRDRAIYLGTPEDLPEQTLAPGLPTIRDWARRNITFAGPIDDLDGAGRRIASELQAIM